MLLCEDAPTLDEFLPPGSPRRAHAVGDLPTDDRRLWRAFSDADPVWVATPSIGAPFWQRVLVVGHANESQFDVLRDRVAADAAGGGPIACLALEGREFHGHRGRPWTALRGNIHLSAALRPGVDAERLGLGLTTLPAVATVDAVRVATEGRLTPDLKWVNDVMIGGRKVGGVLTGTQTQGRTVELAVLGIGLNVARAPDVSPTPFVPATTCLHDAAPSGTFGLPHVFWVLLDALANRYATLLSDGPTSLFGAYRDRSNVIGRRVRIWEEGLNDGEAPARWPPPLARGVVVGMAPDLSLRLAGRDEQIVRGRLAFEEACRAYGL